MFRTFDDRDHAGRLLADELRDEAEARPVVLAIPRGGIEVGAAIADRLRTELDVVLARKLRAPLQPELAVGAVSEEGEVFLIDGWESIPGMSKEYVDRELTFQRKEIGRRQTLFRSVRPPVPLSGRHVIIADDGIATGSTMIAALQAVRGKGVAHVTVAVPVASPDRLPEIRPLCDRLVCLLAPESFQAVGQFYRSFESVEDERVVEMLRRSVPSRTAPGSSAPQ